MITSDAVEAFVESSMDYGMTHEQIKNFVVNSHVTEPRKLRQILVEIERRNHDRKKVILDQKRKQVEIDRLRSKLEVVANQYDRQLIELDIEEYELDVSKFQVTLHQYDNELQPFLDWINERYGSIEELSLIHI